jgi:hypothetical protein
MTTQIQHIWPLETGIADIERPWTELASSEVASIATIWAEQQERLKGTRQLLEFTERLSREWAIETGIIENLYQIDRGITQTLIERGFQAELLTHGSTNKPQGYVLNLLKDQKDALDGVFDFVAKRRSLSASYIKELHAALVRSQRTTEAQDANGNFVDIPLIRGDWKVQRNFPSRDGVVYAYCPPEHVASEIDRLVALHLQHVEQGVSAEVEAAWLHHRFSQIHPFQDGNGRVARALASLVFVRARLFPLVITRDDKTRYLDGLEAADKGNLLPLVDFFAALQRTQFRKATALSENILAAGADIAAVMGSLLKTAAKTKETREREQRKVFEHSKALEADTEDYLRRLVPSLQEVMLRLSQNASCFVSRSTEETDYFYRAQIIQNARDHLDYFADTSSYRSWVSLNFNWERRARLVFAFHGIGRPFSGSLICAPFFEFRDLDDGEQAHSTIIPVAEEGLIFFYNEPLDRTQERFRAWRDRVVTVALKEFEKSL